jgi:hypothetical protein
LPCSKAKQECRGYWRACELPNNSCENITFRLQPLIVEDVMAFRRREERVFKVIVAETQQLPGFSTRYPKGTLVTSPFFHVTILGADGLT